jgi:hypothetical protein
VLAFCQLSPGLVWLGAFHVNCGFAVIDSLQIPGLNGRRERLIWVLTVTQTYPTAGAFSVFVCAIFVPMPRTFLYRCPNTGQTVQGWSADEVTDEDDTYQSFECTFCTRVHLVNLKTGKLLGGEED